MPPSVMDKRRQALAALLKDPSPEVREAAARALERMEEMAGVEEILFVLKKGALPAKIKAIYALGKVGGEKVLAPLMYCASRPEEELRAAAIEVLGELAEPKTLPALVERLNDESPAIRANAIAAIGHFPLTVDLVKRLVPFLASGDGLLDAEALTVLRKARVPGLEGEYIRLLGSPHPRTRKAAVLALGELPVT